MKKIAQEYPIRALHEINYSKPDSILEYKNDQIKILKTAYDLSRFNYINHGLVDNWIMKNKIIDEYSKRADELRRMNIRLSAEDFMKNFIEILADNYNLEYQEPYAQLKKYKQFIENTIENGNTDISKCKIKEIKIEDFAYYVKKEHQRYSLKFFQVHLNGEDKVVIFAAKESFPGYPETEFTLANGLLCMQDLKDNYGI